jgi:hypothetical protein
MLKAERGGGPCVAVPSTCCYYHVSASQLLDCADRPLMWYIKLTVLATGSITPPPVSERRGESANCVRIFLSVRCCL